MKLRNKKTGEIGELAYFEDKVYVLVNNELKTNLNYTSLAELNEEWEDYEEPKQWYGLNAIRDVGFEPLEYEGFEDLFKHAKELGIAFETKEEAEKALDKLKAWKRLKDARFEFGTIKYNLDEESSSTIAYDGIITIKGMAYEDFVDDINLLFGGEE